MTFKNWMVAASLMGLSACASLPQDQQHTESPEPVAKSSHLTPEQDAAEVAIPAPVQALPLPPAPEVGKKAEQLFTIVVTDVPLKELLFTLARDADTNIDVHDDITGNITINAIDQTLSQILSRIQSQAAIRYRIEPGLVTVSADKPYLKQYEIDYPNMTRTTQTEVTIATEVATTGGGAIGSGSSDAGNMSSTEISNQSNNNFWQTLIQSVESIIDDGTDASDNSSDGEEESDSANAASEQRNPNIISNPETGMLTVRATQKQHADLQRYLDQLMESARRQVLIEATVVEVTLNDQYQAGIDWNKIASGGEGISIEQNLTGSNLTSAPVLNINYTNIVDGVTDVTSTIRMLNQFGNTRVLSSPKLMVLNNQTALLKVVDNRVYFTTDVDIQVGQDGSPGLTTFETEIHTVPIGFVMSVTPQVSRGGSVTLNARPTLSRILRFVRDPNPALTQAGVTNLIPEIQVREVESILNIQSGNIGIIGGLIQDEIKKSKAGVPVLAKLPGVGDLFAYRDDDTNKSELVIFLRPVVIKTASVKKDLQNYSHYLQP
jgi:general secretion pathway protein D